MGLTEARGTRVKPTGWAERVGAVFAGVSAATPGVFTDTCDVYTASDVTGDLGPTRTHTLAASAVRCHLAQRVQNTDEADRGGGRVVPTLEWYLAVPLGTTGATAPQSRFDLGGRWYESLGAFDGTEQGMTFITVQEVPEP